jgi:hypothetical protein
MGKESCGIVDMRLPSHQNRGYAYFLIRKITFPPVDGQPFACLELGR